MHVNQRLGWIPDAKNKNTHFADPNIDICMILCEWQDK